MENNIQLATYFVQDIRRIVEDGRQRAYLQVSHTMIETYWNIGQRIVEEEQNGKQRAEYGSKLIDELAKILTHDFGSGFSARYLRSFRKFYLLIPDIEIWKSRFPNLLWTHIYRTLRVADATAARWEEEKKYPKNVIRGLQVQIQLCTFASHLWHFPNGSPKCPNLKF